MLSTTLSEPEICSTDNGQFLGTALRLSHSTNLHSSQRLPPSSTLDCWDHLQSQSQLSGSMVFLLSRNVNKDEDLKSTAAQNPLHVAIPSDTADLNNLCCQAIITENIHNAMSERVPVRAISHNIFSKIL